MIIRNKYKKTIPYFKKTNLNLTPIITDKKQEPRT